MLKDKILNKESGIITYGFTPPKQDNDHEKLVEISKKQIERIKGINVDALVVYDIQDESDRNRDNRTFPFISTVDPAVYAGEYLSSINLPKIIYRCVGKYTKEQLSEWINIKDYIKEYSVFVGAASKSQHIKLSLKDALNYFKGNKHLILGGVTIPERHIINKDEHIRVINKYLSGCKFFISQVTYNSEAAKDFLSDYYYFCKNNDIDMVPILFTFTPCGSQKTLDFMKWLGISLPKWLENDLKHSMDILETSLSLSKQVFRDILEFSKVKNIPVGCNIESLSKNRIEIDASIQLVKEMREMLKDYFI